MQVKVKSMMSYAGHSLKANGNVDMTLKARYSECVNSIALLQMLNNDVDIKIRKGSGKPFKIGNFRIKEVKFDGDGESVVKFNSLTDFVEVDKLSDLIPSGDEVNEFTVLFMADVEDEEEE